MNEYRRLKDVLTNKLRYALATGENDAKQLKNLVGAVRELNLTARETSIPYKIQEMGNMLVTPFLAGIGIMGAAQLGKSFLPPGDIDKKLDRLIQLKPSLASVDRNLLSKYYKTINETAPEATSNPIVAASLLERIINYGGIDHTILKELADTEKSLKDKQFNSALAVSALSRSSM
jgi:hypothetical protein